MLPPIAPEMPDTVSTTVSERGAVTNSAFSKPTKTRWQVLLLISLMYMITYMDRTGISIAAPAIEKDFGLSPTTMGIVFSVFLWAYAIGQIPGGSVADRFGPRLILLIIVPFWSIMTGLTAVATGAASLIVIRFVFGLAESPAFPTATRAMQLWFPKAERGIVHGVTHSFSRLAVAIVPFVAVSIMLAFGWRWIFYIFGAAGLLWSSVFYLLYRNFPEHHPGSIVLNSHTSGDATRTARSRLGISTAGLHRRGKSFFARPTCGTSRPLMAVFTMARIFI